MPPDEKLLTPDQVAERLQISRWTVMEYLRRGKLKGHRVGRLWRITEEDFQDFLKHGRMHEAQDQEDKP